MNRLVTRILGFIGLFVLSGIALADSSGITSLSATAVSNHTDLSVTYLSEVFGTVGSTLQGTSGQMLGQLFYKFNDGVLVAISMFMGYGVFMMIVRATQEGSWMGANRNTALAFGKIALGVTLCIPNPTTGYSTFQDAVMKVAVEGVTLADETWDYGLNYINNGGSLWYRPESGVSAIDFSDSTTKKNISAPEQKIFQDAVCMYDNEYSAAQNTQSGSSSSNNVANTGATPPSYAPQLYSSSKGSPEGYEFPGQAGDNACGYVKFSDNGVYGTGTTTSSGSQTTSATQSAANLVTAQNAVDQMIQNILPAAQMYVCTQDKNAKDSPSCEQYAYLKGSTGYLQMLSGMEQAFYSTTINYINAVMPIAQNAANSKSMSAKDFIGEAQKQGWMMAGRYYWDLSQIQDAYAKVSDVTSYFPNTASILVNTTNSASSAGASFLAHNDIFGNTFTQLQNYKSTADSGDTGSGTSKDQQSSNWIISIFLGPIYADMTNLIEEFNTSGSISMGSDPIMFLHKIGMACMGLAGDIWFELAGILAVILAAAGVCQSVYNASSPINGVENWLKPPLMGVATALLGVGIILGYYVPLYPFIIFTFGVIGWIIAVLEAMVAAPLVCLGLTHPEGHDFLGQAQQALMLLLGVFVRPVLMIIGLIGGMILSYVSLRILVYTYSGFLGDLFYVSSPSSGAASGSILGGAGAAMSHIMVNTQSYSQLIMSLLAFPLFLVIFAALVYVVTNYCYSLVYMLPDNILKWIGGPVQQSMAQQMAGEVRGATSGAGSAAGRFGESAASSKLMHGKRTNDAADSNVSGTANNSDETPKKE